MVRIKSGLSSSFDWQFTVVADDDCAVMGVQLSIHPANGERDFPYTSSSVREIHKKRFSQLAKRRKSQSVRAAKDAYTRPLSAGSLLGQSKLPLAVFLARFPFTNGMRDLV